MSNFNIKYKHIKISKIVKFEAVSREHLRIKYKKNKNCFWKNYIVLTVFFNKNSFNFEIKNFKKLKMKSFIVFFGLIWMTFGCEFACPKRK